MGAAFAARHREDANAHEVWAPDAKGSEHQQETEEQPTEGHREDEQEQEENREEKKEQGKDEEEEEKAAAAVTGVAASCSFLARDGMPQVLTVPLGIRVWSLAGPVCSLPPSSSWSLRQVRRAIEESCSAQQLRTLLLHGTAVLRKEADFAAVLAAAAAAGAEDVQLTLLRTQAHGVLGWQAVHAGGTAVLRNIETGFIIELTGASNGWFRICNSSGKEMVIWSDLSASGQKLSPDARALADQVESSDSQPWMYEEETLQMGNWSLSVQELGEDAPRCICVGHADKGEVLRLGPVDLLAPQQDGGWAPPRTSPLHGLFYDPASDEPQESCDSAEWPGTGWAEEED